MSKLSEHDLDAIRKRVLAQRSRYGRRWNLILKDRDKLLAEVDRLRAAVEGAATSAACDICKTVPPNGTLYPVQACWGCTEHGVPT